MSELQQCRDPKRDAWVLRDRSIPDDRRDFLIALHTNLIEESVTSNEDYVWQEGRISSKVIAVARHVNAMFFEANRDQDIVTISDLSELYELHIHQTKNAISYQPSALGNTVLSAIVFATDKIRGVSNPAGLLAYRRQIIAPVEHELKLVG